MSRGPQRAVSGHRRRQPDVTFKVGEGEEGTAERTREQPRACEWRGSAGSYSPASHAPASLGGARPVSLRVSTGTAPDGQANAPRQHRQQRLAPWRRTGRDRDGWRCGIRNVYVDRCVCACCGSSRPLARLLAPAHGGERAGTTRPALAMLLSLYCLANRLATGN